MRLATYNVENLFLRARALNLDDPNVAKPILDKFAELNKLFEEIGRASCRERVYSSV